MKVYVITAGYYSDYHICAVTTDEKKAHKIAEQCSDRWGDASVEEYDTERVDVLVARGEVLPYEVAFDRNGCVNWTSKEVEQELRGEFEPGVQRRKRDGLVRVSLYATDADAAIKIAAEKRAEYLAREEGLT